MATKYKKYVEMLSQSVNGVEVDPEMFVAQLAEHGTTVEQFEDDCRTYEQRAKWLDDVAAGKKTAAEVAELGTQRSQLLAEAQKKVDQAEELRLKIRGLTQRYIAGADKAKRDLLRVVPPSIPEKKDAMCAESRELLIEVAQIENKLEYGSNNPDRVRELQQCAKDNAVRLQQISNELTQLCELCQSVVWPDAS